MTSLPEDLLNVHTHLGDSMKPKNGFPRRGIALLCSLTLLSGPQALAQTQTDEYWVERPATCPIELDGGLIGWLVGYPNGGFTWTSEWTRYRVPNQADYSHAEYRPGSYDGYAQGKGDYIISRDGAALWYEPELLVRCTATDKFFMGHIVSVTMRYRVIENRGEIEICRRGGPEILDEPTGGGPNATYDPYSQYGESSGCESQGSGGTGSNTNTCHDEYVYVEVSNNGGVTWEIIWEGWAEVCT